MIEVPHDPQTIRAIALLADCHPLTAARFFKGENVRPSIRARIKQAIAAVRLAPMSAVRERLGVTT